MSELTQEKLKEILHYDPETGFFTWVKDRGGQKAGARAGGVWKHNVSNQYRRIGLLDKVWFEHRLVWLYVHGEFPHTDIDHINHKSDDNRLANLRVVSRLDNSRNQVLKNCNKSGVTGVHWNKGRGKWMASIRLNYKSKHLGLFENKEDAIRARAEADIRHGYHPNHGRVDT